MSLQPVTNAPSHNAMAEALAQAIRPGVTVFLPHREAGMLCTAMLRAGKPVRIATATRTHSAVTHTRSAPTVARAVHVLSWRRLLVAFGLVATLAALAACGGGDDLVEADTVTAPVPTNPCAANPRACI